MARINNLNTTTEGLSSDQIERVVLFNYEMEK